MEIPQLDTITTADQARDLVIDWSMWVDEHAMSYQELADWQAFFRELARKFDLRDEFEENGII